jgi:hypothetical protein
MAGYVIAVVAFALPFVFGLTRIARPRLVLGVGAVLAFGWLVSLAAVRAQDVEAGNPSLPLWFLAGLVVLLYLIWCGGLWLGIRVRRVRTR